MARTLAGFLLAGALTVVSGCKGDALYTFCRGDLQCGSRTYNPGEEDEYEVFLVCIEATVEVTPGRTTVGAFCTLDCASDGECDAGPSQPSGACIQWAGDPIAYCYQRCTDQGDCYPSSTCETVMRRGAPLQVCVPGRV